MQLEPKATNSNSFDHPTPQPQPTNPNKNILKKSRSKNRFLNRSSQQQTGQQISKQELRELVVENNRKNKNKLRNKRLQSYININAINNAKYQCNKLNSNLIKQQYFCYINKPYGYIMDTSIKQFNKFQWKINPLFQTFLSELSSLYNDVPYHNITHAFDVSLVLDQYLMSYDNILCRINQLKQQTFNIPSDINISFQRIIYLITAYAHDCGHQGFTSSYYINSDSDLAINYLYSSPLEQMHASNLLALFRKYPQVLNMLTIPTINNVKKYQRSIKNKMVKMIIATDNSLHEQTIQRFRSMRNKIKTMLQKIKTIDKVIQTQTIQVDSSIKQQAECTKTEKKQAENVKRNEEEHLTQSEQFAILQMMLHCADINSCTKDTTQLILWTSNLYDQFRNQEQIQKSMNLPNSFINMNFEHNSQSQIYFLNHFVLPLYQQITYIEPTFSNIIENINANKQFYLQFYTEYKQSIRISQEKYKQVQQNQLCNEQSNKLTKQQINLHNQIQ